MLQRFLREDEGATAIEYAVIAALVSVVIIAGATVLGTTMSVAFDYVATTVNSTSS